MPSQFSSSGATRATIGYDDGGAPTMVVSQAFLNSGRAEDSSRKRKKKLAFGGEKKRRKTKLLLLYHGEKISYRLIAY